MSDAIAIALGRDPAAADQAAGAGDLGHVVDGQGIDRLVQLAQGLDETAARAPACIGKRVYKALGTSLTGASNIERAPGTVGYHFNDIGRIGHDAADRAE